MTISAVARFATGDSARHPGSMIETTAEEPRSSGVMALDQHQLDRRIVTIAFVLLVLFAAGLWLVGRPLSGLFLLPPAVWCLVYLLGQRQREWLVENTLSLMAVSLTGWLLIAFGLWLLVNFAWAADEGQLATDAGEAPFFVDKTALTAGIAYPSVALADAADAALTFSFSPEAAAALPREVMMATVTLPPELAFAVAGGPSTRAFAVPIDPGMLGTRRIGVVNSGAYRGWIRRETNIYVALCPPAGDCLPLLSLPVRVEGRNGYAARRFVNSTVNQASPLILLLLLAVPGLAALAQRAIDERRKALDERKRAEFDLHLKRFQEQFRGGLQIDAQKTRKQLGESRYENWHKESLETADALLNLAQLTLSKTELNDKTDRQDDEERRIDHLLEVAKRWPREFAEGYLQAKRALPNDQPPAPGADAQPNISLSFVQQARHKVRFLIFSDNPDLEVRLAAAVTDPIFLRTQRRLPLTETAATDYIVHSRRLAFPFARPDAQDLQEQRFLRANVRPPLLVGSPWPEPEGYFWPDSLAQQFQRSAPCLIVHGPEGCGRTAAFVCYPPPRSDAYRLPVKLVGTPAPAQAAAAMARQLLRYILVHPTFLEEYGPGERALLGRVLLAHLGEGILARIEQTQTNIKTIHNLTIYNASEADNTAQPADATADEARTRVKEKTIRLQEGARVLLEEFKQTVAAGAAQLKAPCRGAGQDTDFRLLREAAGVLGFREVVFAYDCTHSMTWVESFVLNRLDQWQDADMAFCLFVPDPLLDHLSGDWPSIPREAFRWRNQTTFRRMLEWRLEMYLEAAKLRTPRERRRALAACFERGEDDLKRMLEASRIEDDYNPRRFMKLWCAAAGDKEYDRPLTKKDVDGAIKGIE